MARLAGKVALITGAASNPGIGYATAHSFAREGAKVVATDIDRANLEHCQTSLMTVSDQILTWRQDVTSRQDWIETVERILNQWGRIDILVNNAGVVILKSIDELTEEDFERQMRINMTSVFLGTKQVISTMREHGGGAIVNLSSVAGLVGAPGVSAYSSSKAAVHLFTKNVAIECAKHNIRCNSVHPGSIHTNIQKTVFKDIPEQFELINSQIPLGHMGTPEDVAASILFLASDEAKYITGAELVVDGGLAAQ
ncbi:MAG: SDR family oxidoreductase [Porticoccaceae bacterium]|nr:SDR family oxidoreductase [Porticoccaceae bacterium]